jgi:hypothetical protein
MRRRNPFSFEQEREIFREILAGVPQSALASKYGVNQPLISRILKKHCSLPFKINCPTDTAYMFEAHSVNFQASYQPVLPNGIVTSMDSLPVTFVPEGASISARPFKSPSGTAALVPAHAVYGHPPEMNRNECSQTRTFLPFFWRKRKGLPVQHQANGPSMPLGRQFLHFQMNKKGKFTESIFKGTMLMFFPYCMMYFQHRWQER